MKLKLCVLTALSLAGLALSATPASAWWLHRHGVNRYATVVVCRPYNAFTPVTRGSLICDGCCPFACPQLPGGAACSPLLGNPMLGMCGNPAALNSAYQMPMMQQAPMMAAPGMPVPAYMQPGQPAPVPTSMQQTQAPMGYMVQPAAYQPGAYPMYYPVNPYQQAPAYWYGY